ncbi:MAG TPA: 8-amino-7-oxononanoate synthase [Parasegetibacter sp.]
MNDQFLQHALDQRRAVHAYRQLTLARGLVDFSSNDYLGIARNKLAAKEIGDEFSNYRHGSGGSRLITGNSIIAEETEKQIALFHEAEAALLFNSGYDANLGLLSAVPQRGDHILYDQFSHASIRDGIRLSFASAFSFAHNSVEDLEKKLQLPCSGRRFVVTESVFSMHGDQPPLERFVALCERYDAYLIIDEAHAIGIVGDRGEGLTQSLNLHKRVFARVFTFGKAGGCHGACVAGSARLRDYLINFSRAFIYTTALPEASIAAIQAFYRLFPAMQTERKYLCDQIQRFQQAPIQYHRPLSLTPIQVVVIPGNEEVKQTERKLHSAGLHVKAIMYPTVPKGEERLRIVFHSFNTPADVNQLIECLK